MGTTPLTWIALVAMSIAVVALAILVRRLLGQPSDVIERRLGMMEHQPGLQQLRRQPELPRPSGMASRFDRWFDQLVSEATPELTPQTALLVVVAAGLSVGGVLFVWREDLIAGLAGMLTGSFLVVGFFFYRRARRRRAIREQFPDVIDLLAHAVRAGESIDQAIQLAGKNASEPLASQFRRCAGQLKLGRSLSAVVHGRTQRVPLAEARILAATLIVQRRAGGTLSVTLDRLAHVCRDRLSYHRQYRAATAAGRGGAVLIASITGGAAAYMLIWRPEYVRGFLEVPQGHILLAIAIGLQIVGLTWIYKLLTIDY